LRLAGLKEHHFKTMGSPSGSKGGRLKRVGPKQAKRRATNQQRRGSKVVQWADSSSQAKIQNPEGKEPREKPKQEAKRIWKALWWKVQTSM
jgi:hypothetical protein